MRRFFSLLLAAAMLLSLVACGSTPNEPGTQGEDEPTRDGVAAQYLADFAVRTADYPALPAAPSESELAAAFEALDYDKMGAEAYETAQQQIWDDWDARSEAYYTALRALRSEGTAYPDAFLSFTRQVGAALLSGEENTVLSPANLYLALAMLSETTDGASRDELLTLLGLADSDEARDAANYIWRNLCEETENCGTRLAASLWLNEGVPYNESTLDILAENYLASTYRAPMGTQETDRAIAAWVNENTGGLLEQAAGNLETSAETVMLLLTTLYFKDAWSDDFAESLTAQDIFTAFDGAQQTVDFMHKTQSGVSFTRGENYTVAQLRFEGGQSMRFLLPDEGTTLESLLSDGSAVGGLLIYDMGVCRQVGELIWSVPKFDVSSDLALTDALKALGVTAVFDADAADFSPLLGEDEGAAVTRVQHAARVTVDETGCEAAAFTAIAADSAAPLFEDLPTVEMNLNRPFTFLITGADGLPLFLGTVNSL